ncbi:hypothetical protein CEV34_1016 [Brucella pseudogrignonensis]|uniref:Uncharacterized protein n=1 Tax=Brucella pseudogrignonensis TaxID=419475 RepID=A0A256GPM9_9HYPH|nr:hypothetical protein CEV34_1016 [Brucella pseudogrignonensis]
MRKIADGLGRHCALFFCPAAIADGNHISRIGNCSWYGPAFRWRSKAQLSTPDRLALLLYNHLPTPCRLLIMG